MKAAIDRVRVLGLRGKSWLPSVVTVGPQLSENLSDKRLSLEFAMLSCLVWQVFSNINFRNYLQPRPTTTFRSSMHNLRTHLAQHCSCSEDADEPKILAESNALLCFP